MLFEAIKQDWLRNYVWEGHKVFLLRHPHHPAPPPLPPPASSQWTVLSVFCVFAVALVYQLCPTFIPCLIIQLSLAHVLVIHYSLHCGLFFYSRH